MSDTDYLIDRAKAVLKHSDTRIGHGLLGDLVAELEKYRDIAERLDVYSADELDTAVTCLGLCIEIGKWGHWGLYALEGLFEDLCIEPGDDYPAAVARIRSIDWEEYERVNGSLNIGEMNP